MPGASLQHWKRSLGVLGRLIRPPLILAHLRLTLALDASVVAAYF